MTFDATSPSYWAVRGAGFDWAPTPFRPFRERARGLFVLPSTAAILANQTTDQGFGPVAANALISKFVEGRPITVSRCEEPKADLKRMLHVDEFWTLCIRRPSPGWRFIGRFIARDSFVVLHAVHRDELAPAKTEASFLRALDVWSARLGYADFVQSEHLTDYLSGQYNDLDQERP